jgi:mycothiol system anti-sigma-R factor
MSCGNPHETPCSEVLETVSAYLDGEISPHDKARLAQHFEECSPCLQEAGVYEEVKTLIARSCGCEPCPDDVRDRVISRIRAVTVTTEPGLTVTSVTSVTSVTEVTEVHWSE